MIGFIIGLAAGLALRHYWPQPWTWLWEKIKAKLPSWGS